MRISDEITRTYWAVEGNLGSTVKRVAKWLFLEAFTVVYSPGCNQVRTELPETYLMFIKQHV
jgi:hypothetical protein